jgi:signal transduction histidine kinase
MLRNIPIQKKLTIVILFTTGAVFLLTTLSFFTYDFFTFRQTTIRHLNTLGEIVADNSTAALAFDDPSSANEILQALKAENHIIAACIYNEGGQLFAAYPAGVKRKNLPGKSGINGFRFNKSFIEGFLPIHQDNNFLGTLYLKSDNKALTSRLKLYLSIALLITFLTAILTWILSRQAQRQISRPILALAETARIISDEKDYSVRAATFSKDEIGTLSNGFNCMLEEIEKMEKSLKDTNRNLEDRVTERTQELENLNRELESFSYSVSHDLKAPLRIIQNYSGMLKEEYALKMDDNANQLTDRIIRNAQRMNTLIDDMLSLAHLRSVEPTMVHINMSDLVEQVINEAENLEKEERSIEIIKGKLLPVTGDVNLMLQVLRNLIFNAFKYTRNKEKAVIEIGSYKEGNEVIYFVKDNGAGFEMEYKQKLFNVFQRLHSDKNFEGTGVGLAIVKRIIARHKGSVWAEGKVNEGATFYFSIPVLNTSKVKKSA